MLFYISVLLDLAEDIWSVPVWMMYPPLKIAKIKRGTFLLKKKNPVIKITYDWVLLVLRYLLETFYKNRIDYVVSMICVTQNTNIIWNSPFPQPLKVTRLLTFTLLLVDFMTKMQISSISTVTLVTVSQRVSFLSAALTERVLMEILQRIK